MAREEKPYRVYRGGRAKGKVPTTTRGGRVRTGAGAKSEYRGPGASARTGRHWRRRITLGVLALVVLLVLWGVAGWLSVSSGVSDANKRLDPNAKAALTHQNGLLLSTSTTILLLGIDNAPIAGRTGDMHSDSIMLMRTDRKSTRLNSSHLKLSRMPSSA